MRAISIAVILFTAFQLDNAPQPPDHPTLPTAALSHGTRFVPLPDDPTHGFIFSNHQELLIGEELLFVNTATGHLSFQWVDLYVGGPLPLVVGRAYDSRRTMIDSIAKREKDTDFGPGWRIIPGDTVTYHRGTNELVLHSDSGTDLRFSLDNDSECFLPLDSLDSAVEQVCLADNMNIIAYLRGQIVEVFSASQEPNTYVLRGMQKDDHWWHFYRINNQLLRIENERGYLVDFTRKGATAHDRAQGTGRVVAIADSERRGSKFKYDIAGRLTEVGVSEGPDLRLHYDAHDRLTSVDGYHKQFYLSAEYSMLGRVTALYSADEQLGFQYDDLRHITFVRSKGVQLKVTHSSSGAVTRMERLGQSQGKLSSSGPFDSTIELVEGGGPCGEGGYCPANMSGAECMEYCWSNGGGGGGGGGQEVCNFEIIASPTQGSIYQTMHFQVNANPYCVESDTHWQAPGSSNVAARGSSMNAHWPSPGLKTVSATNNGVSKSVQVDIAPACSFTISGPSSPVVGEEVAFTASPQNCVSTSWDAAPSGCPATGTGATFNTVFKQTGIVNLNTQGSNPRGQPATLTTQVNVGPCETDITGPAVELVGRQLCFDASSDWTNYQGYSWEAVGGNPSTGTGAHFCTSYGSEGQFTIGVTAVRATSNCGTASCGPASSSVTILEPPRIDSITPSRGMIGSTVRVQIDGAHFRTDPSVQALGGITASIISHSDTRITADIALPITSSGGECNMIVLTAGLASNYKPVFVQIPTRLGIVSSYVLPHGPNASTDDQCVPPIRPSDGGLKASIRYQVQDQQGQAIEYAGLYPYEDVTQLVVTALDDGQVNYGSETLNSLIGGTRLGTPFTTTADGQFVDAPFGACSNYSPAFSPFRQTGRQAIRIKLAGQGNVVIGSWTVQDLSFEVYAPTCCGAGTITVGSSVVAHRP